MASRDFWIAKAHRLRVRRNLAFYADAFLPAALMVSGAAAAALLLLRTLRRPIDSIWWCLAAAIVLAAVASWFWSRRKFLRSDEALVRLEQVGRLHNRLSAAQAGVGDWPSPQSVKEPTRWNWSRLLGPLALSAMLLLGGAWLPVAQLQPRERTIEQPIAWAQVESWLQTIEESKLFEQEPLDEVRAQLDQLREQSPDGWYNQSSLEAGDTLREQTEQALRGTLQELEKTEETLSAMANAGEKAAPAQLQAMNNSLQESLRGLEIGNLPLNKELLADLKKLDASKIKQLSPEQLKELQSRVQEGARVAQQCVRPGSNLKEGMLGEKGAGGGPGGGGGPAPLALNDEATNLRTKQTDTVSNEDVSQALPGDLIGVQTGEHDVKQPGDLQQLAGGGVASTGEGGEAVRRESFTPKEREVLQRFFK